MAKRTTGIAPDQLVEPLRELCMSGCAESAKEVKDKDVEPGEVNQLGVGDEFMGRLES